VNPHLQRGLLLLEQSRYELAEAELRGALAEDPSDAHAHASLAICLASLEKLADATDEARQAIHLAPDFPFAHYALAHVLVDRDRYSEAQPVLAEAIRLEPEEPAYHSLMASIHFSERRWKEALASAEQGLQFDPDHVGCNNFRALALVKLRRPTEAGATIEATLARNPDNSVTHANQGWACLDRGDRKKAFEHFREALRLDPTNDWARAGIVETLKAGNIIYALMLKYFLWMSKLSGRTQWAILLGGFLGNQMLGGLARNNPALAPWVLPLRIAYGVFALLTWTADPLFNLLLRLNKFGRLALSPQQVTATNWVGLCLGLALVSTALAFATPHRSFFIVAALIFGFLVLPVAIVFKCSRGWPRTAMIAYAAALAIIGVTGLAFELAAFITRAVETDFSVTTAIACFGLFGIGAIGTPWVGNILVIQRPKR
jgi:Tfp pilus assembly protein PilF